MTFCFCFFFFFFLFCLSIVPQDPPINIQASVRSSTSVYLTYSPPLVPYGFITSYSISVMKSYDFNSNATVLMANSSGSYLVDSLSPYTYYNISIAASTRIGSGPYSSIHIRTLQDSKFPNTRQIVMFFTE